MLEDAERFNFQHIVSWQIEGRSFKVHNPSEFAKEIMSSYFHQTRYKSFQRQLNLYGFMRIHHGPTKDSYAHRFFVRGDPSLSRFMSRNKSLPAERVTIDTLRSDPKIKGQKRNNKIGFPGFGMDSLVSPPKSAKSSASQRVEQEIDDSIEYTWSFQDPFERQEQVHIADEPSIDLFEDIEKDPLFQSLFKNSKFNPWNEIETKDSSYRADLKDELAHLLAENDSDDGIHNDSEFIDIDAFSQKFIEPKPHMEHSFPWKLYDMLENAENQEFEDIVSWEGDGRCFQVHKAKEFVERVLPLYFDQTKFESFRRQLNVYGFTSSRGQKRGTYNHKSFIRGERDLCRLVTRQGAK